jgi:hypothetical protein
MLCSVVYFCLVCHDLRRVWRRSLRCSHLVCHQRQYTNRLSLSLSPYITITDHLNRYSLCCVATTSCERKHFEGSNHMNQTCPLSFPYRLPRQWRLRHRLSCIIAVGGGEHSEALVSKITVPTERPPLVSEVRANSCG